MKRIIMPGLCLILFVFINGCISSPKLAEDHGASSYMNGRYKKVVYSGLEFYISTYELQRDMRVLDEFISSTSKMKEAEKKKIREKINTYNFSERGYLVYKFKIWDMAKVDANEFRFEFTDKTGETIIQDIIFIPKEVKVTKMKNNAPAGISSEIYYEYLWAIKLKKQLIPANYPAGKYRFIIHCPDNSSFDYDIEI